MLKTKAIELLGGSVASAAKEIGVSYQAVEKWPDELPSRIADRVVAAVARKHLDLSALGLPASSAVAADQQA
jgi:molybdenum-dependent DNA-binding transcriptional regulator ModE